MVNGYELGKLPKLVARMVDMIHEEDAYVIKH